MDAPALEIESLPEGVETGSDAHLTTAEEDAILRDTAGTFADWVAAFLRRVILLFENLPEEGPNGAAGGATEGECKDFPSADWPLTRHQCNWWTRSLVRSARYACTCPDRCTIWYLDWSSTMPPKTSDQTPFVQFIS